MSLFSIKPKVKKEETPLHAMVCFRKHTESIPSASLDLLCIHMSSEFNKHFKSDLTDEAPVGWKYGQPYVRMNYFRKGKPKGYMAITIKQDEVDVLINISIKYGKDIYLLFSHYFNAIRHLLEIKKLPFCLMYKPINEPVYFKALNTVHDTLRKVSNAIFPLQAIGASNTTA